MITLSSLVREIGVESRARSTIPDNGLPDQKAPESGASWNSEAVRVLRVQEESGAPQIAVLQGNGDPVLASGITSRRTIAVLVMQRPRWIKATSLHGAGAKERGRTLMTHETLPALESFGMSQADLAALRSAVEALERPSLAARLANVAGKPIELIEYALPTSASQAITAAASKGLEAALQVALRTIQRGSVPASQRFHKALATASGAVGGAFGLGALPLELPVSTVIMLRSIAEIARSEGEDLSDPEAALSCVQVFALGGRPGSTDASESGYFAVRAMLAKSVTQAARFIVERGVVEEGGPILVRFITQVASRFGVMVSQKLAAQAIPLIGALGGAAVNYAFVEHFQEIARGHFTVRRLERAYGKDIVRREYERFAQLH